MKIILNVIALLICLGVNAQNDEKLKVKNTIDNFFEAFHKRDSIGLKEILHPNMKLQSIALDEKGAGTLTTTDHLKFVRSNASIPDSVRIHEKLLSYTIQLDATMATVWTPYEFWLNDKFHHCGVNSFQLFKEEERWRIIYLVDTRHTKDCIQ